MRAFGITTLTLSVLLAGCPPQRKTDEAKAPAAADTGPIKIGEFGSLTGSEATFGTSTHAGIMLAVEEENGKGGVNGRKLEVVTYDDQGKQEEAATAVTRLITQDRVVAILGEVASSRSLAGGPIAQKNRVPMISPSSTNPKVTQVGDYIFRVCFIDPFQGTVMAKFAKNSLGFSKVAIFRDVGNDYSVGLADYFKETFEKLGGTIVADESYKAQDPDFRSQLTTIRSKEIDAIFVPGYYTDVGLIARQARDLGIKVPLLGGDGWDSEKLHEIGGEAIAGSYFSNHASLDDPAPHVQGFVKAYAAANEGKKPDALALLGYDAAKVLVDAMRRAKSLDGPDLRDAIAATKDYAGASGKTTIDENRDARKPAVVLKVAAGGKYEYVETINP